MKQLKYPMIFMRKVRLGFTVAEMLVAFTLSIVALGLTIMVIISSLNMFTKHRKHLSDDFVMTICNSTIIQKVSRSSYISVTNGGLNMDIFDYNKVKTGSFSVSANNIIFTDYTKEPNEQKIFENVTAIFADPNGAQGIHINKVRIDYQTPFKVIVVVSTDLGYMGSKACNLNSFGGNGGGYASGQTTNSWSILLGSSNGPNDNESATSVTQAFNAEGERDGYIIGGVTKSYGSPAGGNKFYLLKVSNEGEYLWSKVYSFCLSTGFSTNDMLRTVCFTRDPSSGEPDGYFITGWVTDSNPLPDGFPWYVGVVMRTNLNGFPIWARLLRTTVGVFSGIQASDGDFVISAIPMPYPPTSPPPAGYTSGIKVVKLSNAGDTLWSVVNQVVIQDPPNADYIPQTVAYYLRETFGQNGNPTGYVICGSTSYNTSLYTYIGRLNTAGAMIWHKVYEAGFAGEAVRQIYGSGHIPNGYLACAQGRLLIRVDESGDLIWARRYTGAANPGFFSMNEVYDGSGQTEGLLIGGITYVPPTANPPDNAYALKVDFNGNLIWSHYFGGRYGDSVKSVAQSYAADGTPNGYILAGVSESFTPDLNNDIYVIKTDVNGHCQTANQCPKKLYNTPSAYTITILESDEHRVQSTVCPTVFINLDEFIPVYAGTISAEPT